VPQDRPDLDGDAAPLAGRVLDVPGSAFVVAEWRDPGGSPDPPRLIAPPHVHHRDDEAWYVLEGALRFRLGEREVTAAAGSAVAAPRGTPHTYWNPAPEPARYLLVMTRAIFQLIEDLHALPERTPEGVRAVFARYDSELVG